MNFTSECTVDMIFLELLEFCLYVCYYHYLTRIIIDLSKNIHTNNILSWLTSYIIRGSIYSGINIYFMSFDKAQNSIWSHSKRERKRKGGKKMSKERDWKRYFPPSIFLYICKLQTDEQTNRICRVYFLHL